MNIITTDDKTGKPQVFDVSLDDARYQHTSHLLALYGQSANLRKLDEAVRGLRSSTRHNVVFTPLIEGRENVNQYGISAWRGSDDDLTPFVIRGRRLPTVKTVAYHGGGFWWRATSHGETITKAQAEELQRRFDAQLHAALTVELLEQLKQKAVADLVEYAKREVSNYRRQLAEIEAYDPSKRSL